MCSGINTREKNEGRCGKGRCLGKPGCKRGPVGHRQGPVGLGVTHHRRFFITYRRCEPVIYEYHGEKDYRGKFVFATKLTWPQKNRVYYKVGDVILLKKTNSKWLERVYSSLAPKKQGQSLLKNLVDSEILGLAPDYKVGQVITSIEPFRGKPGQGVIKTKPVIFFGEKAVYLSVESPARFNEPQLFQAYTEVKLSLALNNIVPWLALTSEIMTMVITGAIKSVVSKSVSVYVLRKSGLKAATKIAKDQAEKALLKSFAKNVGMASFKASTAFALAFLKSCSGSAEEQALRTAAGNKVNYKVLETAIKDGAQAFALTFVSELLGAGISSWADKAEVSKITENISKKVITLVTTEPTGVLINAYRKAGLAKQRQQLDKNQKGGMAMGKEMTSWFEGQMKGILKDIISNLL